MSWGSDEDRAAARDRLDAASAEAFADCERAQSECVRCAGDGELECRCERREQAR